MSSSYSSNNRTLGPVSSLICNPTALIQVSEHFFLYCIAAVSSTLFCVLAMQAVLFHLYLSVSSFTTDILFHHADGLSNVGTRSTGRTDTHISRTECVLKYNLSLNWSVHNYEHFLFVSWRNNPQWARASSFTRFLDHTQRRTTVDRTPLDEWSARRRDLYLKTHNNHIRQTSMPPVAFGPTVSGGEGPQTHAWDRAATGTGSYEKYVIRNRNIAFNKVALFFFEKMVGEWQNAEGDKSCHNL